ncbi:putative ribonuclease H-like domain-containing protein [Tanacetum coccineum]
MAGSDDEIPPPPPPPQTQTPTQQAPHTVSTIKLPILKKGEYDIWAMKMEHYLAHTDYPIWEVIQRGNGPVSVSTDTNGVIKVLPPKTAEEILARERERKARTTLLMALPEDHLAKFHKMTDAKEMWEAIKSRFGGNDESKKMQKYILKQQFEGFSVSNSEGLHKGYDRFQSLLSQLEIHGAGVSTEDANQKFLRSLPSAWSQISLIMRTKPINVAFVFKNTSSTNEVSTAYGASSSSGHNPQREGSSSYTDELMYSFFANQSSGPQLDHEDLEQLDEFDLEEMDLKWQVAMISMRLKKFYKKTGRKLQFDAKEPVGFDKAKVECYNCHKTGHFARECRSKGNQDSRRRDAGYTGYKAKDSGRRPGKQEEPKALVTLDGEGVDWTSHSEDEQENYALMAYSNSGSDTDDKTDVLTYHKKLLAEAEKEKEELKAKVEKWHNSSKNLNVLLTSQMSARDKARLGSSDIEDSPVNDRYAEGMHAVPPPMTGIYILSGPDVEIDESHEETLKSMPEPVVNEPKVVSQPKVWSNAPIIEEYESDSDNDCVTTTLKEQETPSFAFVNTVKHVKTLRQTVKEQNTCSQNPKTDKKDCSGLMSKKLGLGYGFTKKACFVCGSFSHLIRDCDFHEKRIAKQAELNKRMYKGTGQRENRPVWNNVKRVNHQNQFVPTAVLIRTGKIPVNTASASSTNNVNTARHNFNSQSAPTNAARKVNTVKPIINNVRPKTIFHKTKSPIRRPFYKTTAPRTNFSNQKVNTDEVKAVSAVGGKRKLLLSPQQVVIREPKYIIGTKSPNTMVDQILENDAPHKALENKGIVDSGCSRHMTGNKAYLAEYQDYNSGPIAFGGSKGYITGKGKIKTGKLDFKDVCFVKELQHSILCHKCVTRRTRFSWVFFLRTKDETSGILKDFIRQIENQLNQKVKTIRCDNGTEFKNRDFIEFCGSKGIKREYSNARTPQQNGVAERKNRTLIEAARTMLADSFLPNTFWAEAVSTACYVLNRVQSLGSV